MTEADFRARVLAIASAELGSEDWAKYQDGVEYVGARPTGRLAWCGIFALWCLVQAGSSGHSWQIGRGIVPALPRRIRLADAQSGDVLYMPRNNHHALFAARQDGRIISIDGNTTRSGAGGAIESWSCVAERSRPTSDWAAAYSIAGLATRVDGTPTDPAPPPSIPRPPLVLSVSRMRSDWWLSQQLELQRAGLYHGRLDGDPGPATCTAVIEAWMLEQR